MKRTLDWTPEQSKLVTGLLQKHLPGVQAWAYGSRARWNARPDSDLDLVVFADHSQKAQVSALREDLEESSLPYKVDLFVWDEVPDNFRPQIEKERVEVSPLAPAPAHRSLSGAEGAVSKDDGQGSSATPLSGAVPRKAPGWSEITLREAGVILIDCDHRTPESSPTGYPYVMIPQIKGGVIDFSGAKMISPKDFAEWTRKAYPTENDIVLSRRCNPGETAYVPMGTKFALGQNLVLLRATGERISPSFLRWLVRGPQWWEQVGRYINVGAVFESLRCADIPKFVLRIPTVSVQKSIAHILGTLDDKIELNRRINQTLEEMAQALFKSWFVDFDPVKAKASVLEAGGTPEQAEQTAMQTISGKTSEELESFKTAQPDAYAELARTASLFPSRLTESELGQIPEGWESIPFGSSLTHTIGGDWGKETPEGKEVVRVRIFRGTDLPKVYLGDDSAVPTRYVDEKKLKNRRLQPGDLVIEVSGGSKDQSTGRSLLVSSEILSRFPDPVEPASFCRLFRPKSLAHGTYLDQHLRYIYRAGKMWGYQNQSTGISNFQTEVFLREEPIFGLDEAILDCFNKQIQNMNSRINGCESLALAECRDSLLPKLLSGELEIPDELLSEAAP